MAQKEVSSKVIEEISQRMLNNSKTRSGAQGAPQKPQAQQKTVSSMGDIDLDSINRIAKTTPPPSEAQMQDYASMPGGDDIGMMESAIFGGDMDNGVGGSIPSDNPSAAAAAAAAAARARRRLNEQASYDGTDAQIAGMDISSMDEATKARLFGYDRVPQGLYIKGIGHVNNIAQNRKLAVEAAKQRNAPQQNPEVQQSNVQVQSKKTAVQIGAKEADMSPYEMLMYDDRYEIYVDLPGVSPENLNVEYSNDGSLVVSGVRESNATGREPKAGKGDGKKRQKKVVQRISTVPKCQLGKFSFEFPLKKMIDETNIKAELDNGILHVTLFHRIKGEKVRIALM